MYCVRWPAVVVLAASVTLSGCGGSDDRVVVFAASSLTDVFDRLEGEYEAANPGVDVVVTTAGSSSLVAQFVDGAPVDVLATADEPTMARARAAASIEADPIDFARNELVIAVELGNPLDIGGLGDLVDGPVVVLAAPEVPAGDYARTAIACAGVEIEPSSLEQSVRAVAAKVLLGEADAGLVYRTDIGDELSAVDLPTACRVRAIYPIQAVTGGAGVQAFMAFVTGPAGDDALIAAGFELP